MKLFRKYDVKRDYYRAKLHFYNNEQEGHRLYQSLKQNKKKKYKNKLLFTQLEQTK